MDGNGLAVTAALLGIVVLISGIVMSFRVARMTQDRRRARARADELVRLVDEALARVDELVASGVLSPDDRKEQLSVAFEAYRQLAGASELRDLHETMEPRPDKRQRTVAVERQDGSTVVFGVDPRNAESVGSFLDDVRRLNGNRVVAVH